MLVNPVIVSDQITSMIASINGNSTDTVLLERGFCQIGHFSLDHCLGSQLKDCWPNVDVEGIPNCYGVCDNPKQFIRKFKKILEKSSRKFVVSFTVIKKENQEPTGGWRWHKWGPYIGTKKPQCEYLYDEPEIKSACCYHVFELN